MRIATWNLERPQNNTTKRSQLLGEKIKEINADIWVLTETHDAISPGAEYHPISSEPAPNPPVLHKEGERRTTIWTCYPIKETIPTNTPDRTVCTDIDTSFGSLLIYGTIIPYHRSGCPPYGTARQWEAHYAAIATQGAEWQRLRRQFPSHGFCMAGDYNQNRDGGRWYGTKWGRSLLTLALGESGLHYVTEEDFIANGTLPDNGSKGKDGKKLSQRSIDHISLSNKWAEQVVKVGAWPGTTESGYQMSDHSGVFVDLLLD